MCVNTTQDRAQRDAGLQMLRDKDTREAFLGDLADAALLVLERVLSPSPFAHVALGALSLGLAAHHNGDTLHMQLAAWLDSSQPVWN